jgi:DNA-directed RNA polymerase subunit RPC12/RpoP
MACTNGSDDHERFCMSRDEFITTTTNYNKRGSLLAMALLLFVFVSMIGYVPFEKPFERYLASRFSVDVSSALATVPIFLPLFLFFGVAIFLSRRKEKTGIACPHCGKNLARTVVLQRIVIASRNCPYCGMKALDEKS